MVFTHSDVLSGIVDSTSLTDENVACLYDFFSELLDTESLAM